MTNNKLLCNLIQMSFVEVNKLLKFETTGQLNISISNADFSIEEFDRVMTSITKYPRVGNNFQIGNRLNLRFTLD